MAFRVIDRCDSGCGNVKSKRGIEFAVVKFDDDFYLRLRPASTEAQRLRLARLATVAWAMVLFALAVLALHGSGA